MRYLTQGEKENSRRLYECCFPEDSQKFVDYYYQEKCRENEIAVIEENGKNYFHGTCQSIYGKLLWYTGRGALYCSSGNRS